MESQTAKVTTTTKEAKKMRTRKVDGVKVDLNDGKIAQTIRDLFDAGKTMPEIAKITGKRPQHVRNVLEPYAAKMGRPLPKDPSKGKRKYEARALFMQGYDVTAVELKLTMNHQHAWRLMDELRKELASEGKELPAITVVGKRR